MTIARGEESATFPARAMVVIACNPCPCGDYHPTNRDNRCTCTEVRRREYRTQAQRPGHRPHRHHPARRAGAAARGPRPARPARADGGDPGAGDRRARAAGRALRRHARGGSTPTSPGPSCSGRWPLTEAATRTARGPGATPAGSPRRGGTRVHRLAWTVADLRGVERPGRRRARRRAAAAHRRAAAAGLAPGRRAPVSDDGPASGWRGSRWAGWASPATRGWPRLVAELGAEEVYDLPARGARRHRAWPPTWPPGCTGSTRRGDLERARPAGHPVRRARRRRVADPARRPRPVRAAQRPRRRAARPVAARRAAASTSCAERSVAVVGLPLRDDVRRRGRRRDRRPPRRRGRRPWCPAPPSASTRPPTAARSPARGPTVAVLACGVDRAYPAAHRDLLDLHRRDRAGGLRARRRGARRPSCASCPATG